MTMSISLSPELERRITEKLQSGEYRSAEELIREGLNLLEAKEKPAPSEISHNGQSIAEMAAAIAKSVPDEEWDRLPADFSRELDHYLYGGPKSSQ
jgi:putative addiction module CopG family antidote